LGFGLQSLVEDQKSQNLCFPVDGFTRADGEFQRTNLTGLLDPSQGYNPKL
jgi:hypothetical protein